MKVAGRWCYLYRAIDREGVLLDSMLSEHRDKHAARRFLPATRRGDRAQAAARHHGQASAVPQSDPWILGRKVVHRTNQYLNNLTQQDHRA